MIAILQFINISNCVKNIKASAISCDLCLASDIFELQLCQPDLIRGGLSRLRVEGGETKDANYV